MRQQKTYTVSYPKQLLIFCTGGERSKRRRISGLSRWTGALLHSHSCRLHSQQATVSRLLRLLGRKTGFLWLESGQQFDMTPTVGESGKSCPSSVSKEVAARIKHEASTLVRKIGGKIPGIGLLSCCHALSMHAAEGSLNCGCHDVCGCQGTYR